MSTQYFIDYQLRSDLNKEDPDGYNQYPVCDSFCRWCDVVAEFFDEEDAIDYVNWRNNKNDQSN